MVVVALKTKDWDCPCCGKTRVAPFEICDICGWQNDTVQRRYPTVGGGANKMSLQEARQAYAEGRKVK